MKININMFYMLSTKEWVNHYYHSKMTKHFKFRIRISIFHAIPESDPKCTTNATNNKAVAGDYVAYCCEVAYRGRWAPVMEWKNNEDVVQAKVESTGNRSYEVNTVKYTYVTELKPSDNNHVFSCRTYFEQPKLDSPMYSGNLANNTPTTDNVLSKYRSPNLTVYCKHWLYNMYKTCSI